MTILLPMMAILSVTSEWSQRSGLTTFTLVPHRGRVIRAKAVVVARRRRRLDGARVRDRRARQRRRHRDRRARTGVGRRSAPISASCSANVLGLMIGFMLGVLIRNSAGAIVAYFVYSFVLPTLAVGAGQLPAAAGGPPPQLDFSWAQRELNDGHLIATEWAQLGTSGLIWLVVPLIVGLVMVMRHPGVRFARASPGPHVESPPTRGSGSAGRGALDVVGVVGLHPRHQLAQLAAGLLDRVLLALLARP